MDEPTSSLDQESKDHLIQTLVQLREKMTIVLVAHRLNIIRCADDIVKVAL